MENTISAGYSKVKITPILLDLFAIAFIYFIPSISHLVSLPVYLIDPMRIMIILALVHTGRVNTFLIAITLPLFSHLISSHPAVIKSILISAELLVNISLFLFISKKLQSTFFVMLLSIVLSKIFYYSAKYVLLSNGIMDGELVSTPLYIQAIVAVALSIYAYFIINSKKLNRD